MKNKRRRVTGSKSKSKAAEEKELDRLSMLPDSLILHILCLVENTKIAVQTCVLSKRWRNLWTHLPSLHLDFECPERQRLTATYRLRRNKNPKPSYFRKFVHRIMSKREPYKIQTLRFCCSPIKINTMERSFLKKVIAYVAKLGVEEVITDNCFFAKGCCRSLRKLSSLIVDNWYNWPLLISLDRPLFASVTCLYLRSVSSSRCDSGDLFSRCVNLEELTLTGRCDFIKAPNFITISSPKLLKLTLNFSSSGNQFIIISAPKLALLNYKGNQKISIDGCPSLERVNIMYEGDTHRPDIWKYYDSWGEPVTSLLVFFAPKVKMFYNQVIGNITPKTKSFVLEHLHWKWIFTKCDNSAFVEIHAPKTEGSEVRVTWKMDVELSSSTSCLEYDWNGFGFFDIFYEVSYASYSDIINTTTSSRGDEIDKNLSVMRMLGDCFDDVIKEKLVRVVQKKKKLLTIC